MPDYLGIDTSNYTTSSAVYRSEENRVIQSKKLLPVKEGELGLRQSDAVFHHTQQLPEMIEKLFESESGINPSAVSVSVRPRNIEGSYMPCFTSGEAVARSISAVNRLPLYKTSHQVGHILSALYSAEKLELINERFIAFHVSGGTTDCLLCEPDEEEVIKVTEIGTSLDLKAGQAVDRVGVMLGLKFPCGAELEKLASKATKRIKIKPVLKGNNCCLSGIENQCRRLLEMGETPENIAGFCIDFITETISMMTAKALENCGELPLIYAGGVMSDKIISEEIISRYKNAYFAKPEYSCDNASGTAIYGYIKHKKQESSKCLY